MKNVMKKLLAVGITVAMTASLAACGGSSASTDTAAPAAPAADAAAPAADAAAPAAEEAPAADAAAPAADGAVKIGVSIWSSNDVLGSQCKMILEEAAKTIGAEVQ